MPNKCEYSPEKSKQQTSESTFYFFTDTELSMYFLRVSAYIGLKTETIIPGQFYQACG